MQSDYNMPILDADAPTVIDVVNGTVLANNQATSYEAAFALGGQFNTVAKHWIDTFPSEYPYDRTRYDEGKSTYTMHTMNSSTNDWSSLGYSSATVSTGSDGWIFWSSSSSTTTTSSHQTVSIDESAFGSGITVSAWGIGTFPIQMGEWCMWLSTPRVLPYPTIAAG